MHQFIDLFRIKFYDGSQRVISYNPSNSTANFNTGRLRTSLEYIGPEQIELTPHLIAWLNNKFLCYFKTNPMLWAISVSTCPEELKPYMILPDDQLTYKGTN